MYLLTMEIKKGWSYSKRIKVLYLNIKVVFNNNSSIDLNTEKKFKVTYNSLFKSSFGLKLYKKIGY